MNDFSNFNEKIKQNKTQKKKLFTRINSGKFKGKSLILPSLESTRSTKSIVRACVFNVLRENLREKIFIEAFGGSALMAAEALSNDAFKAFAIELDKKAFKIALENAKNLSANLEVLNGDTFELLPQILKRLPKEHELILYFDPPFDIREGFEGIYDKVYLLLENLDLSQVFTFIIEHNTLLKTPETICSFSKTKLKKFGATSLSFYHKI